MCLDRVIVFLSNSTLCFYDIHRETALLEKIQLQSELRDCEEKHLSLQQISSMELLRFQDKNEIPSFDREILNDKLHAASISNVIQKKDEIQEVIAFGLSKGSIVFVHIRKMNQLFSRFTIHREAVEIIRYLPLSKTFVSVCKEYNICFWKINNEIKNIKNVASYKLFRPVTYFKIIENIF